MFVIFLDIDGVLNQLQPYRLDERCIECLSLLCNKLGAYVVLTSSWRKGWSRNYAYCSPQIKELIDRFNRYNIAIVGRTGLCGDRLAEVYDYLERHRDITNYTILDDDASEFSSKVDKLYIVNPKTGLTKTDLKKIMRL